MNSIWRRIAKPASILRALPPQITSSNLRTFVCASNVNPTSGFLKEYNNNVSYSAMRTKSKKAKYDSDDEEEQFNDDSSLSKDSKIVKFNTTSLRTDLILKSALNIARNKIEQQFYESKIRLNGKKILKKSVSVKVGDEIDIIKMVSPKNEDHLYVSRVEVLNLAVKDETIVITARRFKNLLIENYETDPYKGSSQSET